MVRVVLAEEKLKLILCRPLPPGVVRVGLLVGKATESRDIIIQAVPTPSLKEIGATADVKGKKSAADDDVDSFTDWWVVEHASQVCAMLPGGLDVVGVFVSYPSLALPAFLPRITKLLRDLAASQDIYKYPTHNYHQLLLQYCQHAEFKLVDLKFREQQEVWVRLHGVLSVDTRCFVSTTSHLRRGEGGEDTSQEDKSRLKQAQQGVAPLLKSIQTALVTLHGRVVQHEDEPLIKKGKGPPRKEITMDVVDAALYLRQTCVTGSPPTFLPGARQVLLRGCLALTAYVHGRATCGEAIAAVKQDAYRTITGRLQIMLEEESNIQGGVVSSQTGAIFQKLPQRVSVSVPTWHQFMLTEYLLPHEKLQECCTSAADQLGVQENLVKVKVLEQLPQAKSDEQLPQAKSDEQLPQAKSDEAQDKKDKGKYKEVESRDIEVEWSDMEVECRDKEERRDKKEMVMKRKREMPLNDEVNYDRMWTVDSRMASVLAAIVGVLFIIALYKFNKLV